MTLTINVPDEVAAQVYAIPENDRQFIDEAVAIAVADALARRFAVAVNSPNPPQLAEYDPMPWDEFAALMIEGIDPNAPELSEYAVSREGIYEDHL